MEAQAIRETLKRNRNGNNGLAVTRDLGIHKGTLLKKIKALGIELPKKDERSKWKKQAESRVYATVSTPIVALERL